MKKTLAIALLLLTAACAEKKEVFDPAAAFLAADEKLQKGAYEDARKAYQEIQEKSPERSYDPAVMLRIADTYFGEEKYEEALTEYRSFLNYHPVNKDSAYAQFQAALCSYNQLTTIDRDPELTRAALREFEALVVRYPGSPFEAKAKEYAAICRNRLADYELYVGRYYLKQRAYVSALRRFEKLVADFPGALAEKDALAGAAEALLRAGERERGKARLDELVQKYPSMADEAARLLREAVP